MTPAQTFETMEIAVRYRGRHRWPGPHAWAGIRGQVRGRIVAQIAATPFWPHGLHRA